MSIELRPGNMCFGPAHVTYKPFDLDEFTYHLCSVICSLNKQKRLISPALSARFVVRLSGNPTAHTSDPGLKQFPLFFFWFDICFVLVVCESVCLENCKVTYICLNSFSILMGFYGNVMQQTDFLPNSH